MSSFRGSEPANSDNSVRMNCTIFSGEKLFENNIFKSRYSPKICLLQFIDTGFFYDFFKTISGDKVEKLRIYAIIIHRSGFSG